MSAIAPFHAFNVESKKGRLNSIISTIGISIPFEDNSFAPRPIPSNLMALWDTGASHCFITEKVVVELGLTPISKTVVFHADGKSFQNVYMITLFLPNGLYIENVEVTETKALTNEFDVIIGMDIITQGDLAITNIGGKTLFTFRLPSQKRIDFVKDAVN